MSLENFWPQSFDKMGRTRGNKDQKDSPSNPGENTQDGERAASGAGDELDPVLAKALNLMTAEFIKVVEEKLGPMAESMHKFVAELQAAG